MSVQEDIKKIKEDVDYIRKMLEDLTMGNAKKDASSGLNDVMGTFTDILNSHPDVNKNSEMKKNINDILGRFKL